MSSNLTEVVVGNMSGGGAANGQDPMQLQQQINASSSISSSSAGSTAIMDGKQGVTNNRANLIVNYLPQSVKEQDFNMLFSKIGPLKTCKLMFDRQTGYSFGYGFVEYVNEEDAKKAIDTLNGYQIEHKRLKVAYARPNCEETKNTNLYIRNIPANYDEHQLHELFAQYGDVIQVRLLRDQNTSFSRRIGFVIMGTKQMAQLAIQHLDNTVPPDASANGGNTEPIYVKYADEDGKKRHPPSMGNSNSALTNLTGGGGGHHHQHHHHHNNPHHHHGGSHHHHHHQQQHQHHQVAPLQHHQNLHASPSSYQRNNHHQQQQQQQQHPLHHHHQPQAGLGAHFGSLGGAQNQFGQSTTLGGVGGGGGGGGGGYQHFNSTAGANLMLGGGGVNTSLQNLGKMKTNRSSGHQNRYSYM